MRNSFSRQRNATGLASLLLWAALLLCTPARATVILDSPRFDLSILPQMSYFEDDGSAFTPDSFQNPALLQQFTPARSNILRFGFTRSTLWLRLQIDNRQRDLYRALLYLPRPAIGLMRVYQLGSDGPQLLGEAGTMTDRIFADINHRAPAISLPLNHTGLQEYLIEMRSDHYVSFSLYLADPNQFYQQQSWLQLGTGMAAGILLLLSIQGSILYLRKRDPAALAFSAYAASVLMYLGVVLGYLGYLWPVVTNLQLPLESVTLLIMCAAILQFIRCALETRNSRHKLDMTLRIALGLLVLLIMLLPFLSPHQQIQLAIAASLLAIPLSVAAVALRAIDGNKPARQLVITRTLVLLAGLLGTQTVYAQLALGIEAGWLLLGALFLDLLMARVALARYGDQRNLQRAEQQQRLAIANAERSVKTGFLSQISHEIRTPMNGILGMAELLEDTSLSPVQEDFVRTINVSGNHLLKILDDILDYSKIETGRMALDIASFDIGLMLEECVGMFKTSASEKRLELITQIQPEVPHHVKGDPARIRQVLANLIGNAIKRTDQGEVAINIGRDPDRSAHHLCFTVTDTGASLNKEALQQLFEIQEPYQEPLQHQDLGLAISQQLIQIMGGNMGAQSQLNKGSIFWFSIPLEADSDAKDTPLPAGQLQGLRLLVVDDNASCRLVLQQQATSWGMTVSLAINGKQALAMLHNQATIHEPFDIVILDHDMAGMSGMELAARIKEDSLIDNDPLVLMLTGLGLGPSSTAARNAGIRRVITKPVAGRLLKQTLLEELAQVRRIQAVHQTGTQAPAELPAMDILVAEDHHLSQKVIKGMLARLGMRTWTVDNGERALELVRKQPFDLVLMDCEMPVMNGFDAASAIRQWEKDEGRPPIPIIALSAHIMDEQRQRSLQAGMNAHLPKPVELSALRDTLQQWSSVSQHSPLGSPLP